MSMDRPLALAQLTAMELAPPQLIAVAAAHGCTTAGLRLIPVMPGGDAYALQDDPALLRETRRVIADTGTGVGDLEILMLRPETDVLHFDRSASTLADLSATPPALLHYWQICDGPAERPTTTQGLLHTARAERLFPGEGGIDLLPIVRAIPPALSISIEVPKAALARTVPTTERVRHAVEATRRVLAEADA